MSVVPTKERLGDNDVSSGLMLLLARRWHSLILPYDLPDTLRAGGPPAVASGEDGPTPSSSLFVACQSRQPPR